MRFAVGTDIVDIEKLRGSFARWGQKLLNRVLTPREYEYCRSKVNFLQSVAGRIASKEAVYKALYQHGVSGVSWKDIEIIDGPTKAPMAVISDRVKSLLPGAEIAISISHTDKQAVAVALVERRQG
jgi:holo-[acyl-carrier protein] synthase